MRHLALLEATPSDSHTQVHGRRSTRRGLAQPLPGSCRLFVRPPPPSCVPRGLALTKPPRQEVARGTNSCCGAAWGAASGTRSDGRTAQRWGWGSIICKYSLGSNRKNKNLLTNLGETHSFLSVRLGFAEIVATSVKHK